MNKSKHNESSKNVNIDLERNNNKNNNKKNVILKILDIILKIILTFIIIFLLFFIIRATVFKKYDIFGYRFYIIMSGSMEPDIKTGDMIITKESDNYKIGDVIAFKDANFVTAHRIVEISTEDGEKVFKTKGDNNNTTDRNLVKSQQIKGKIVNKIPKVGKAVLYLKTHWIILVLLIGIIIIIYLVRILLYNRKNS